MIKADKGFLVKAYMIDINPFDRGLVRRVIIDEFGMVFIPTYGWSNLQGGSEYKIIPLPGQIEKPRSGLFEHLLYPQDVWYERKAWDDEIWSWCYLRRGKMPDFHACYTIDMGDGTKAIFAH